MDDKELDALLSQRYAPQTPPGLKGRLKSIPAKYPRPDNVWQVMRAVFKDFMGTPVAGAALCASLALGVWTGMEVDVFTTLTDQELINFLTVETINEDWL